MSYLLARDAAADQLWFEFLTTKLFDRASKKKLLAQGFAPPSLLKTDGAPFLSEAEAKALLGGSKATGRTHVKSLAPCHLLPWGKQPEVGTCDPISGGLSSTHNGNRWTTQTGEIATNK